MTKEAVIHETEEYVLHTYNRFPVVIDHGEGVRVWDTDGREYLDFMAGIGVYALGYHFPGYDEALIEQIGKVLHTSNLYYHEPLFRAARAVACSTGLEKVFFTNSGAEAVEGAIKAARKYAWLKDGRNDHEIISMEGSFHGRSVGALSVTGNDHYQEPFRPLMGGVRFAEFNDLPSVERALSDRTCAIILETLQGEGGIYPADPEFLACIRRICDERDILLILDEIQCGMGRTGTMWAFEQYGIRPDILTCAKALGCGVPVGAFVLNRKTAEASLMPGDHGTTYGGNPFVLAAVARVFELFAENDIPGRAEKAGAYLAGKLEALRERFGCIEAHRGLGLMRGLAFDESVKASDICSRACEKGLLIITAGGNVLRFVPPLVVTEGEIDEACGILEEVLEELTQDTSS